MKKRVIIITFITACIFTLIMIQSKSEAIQEENYTGIFYHEIEQSNTKYFVSVVVPSNNESKGSNNKLTQRKLKDLIEAKYNKKEIVKHIYKEDGITELNKGENVGTGYIVELTTGRKLTVILYGDINCDGEIDTNDTVALANYNVNKYELNKEQEKSAKLTLKKENEKEINTRDAVRIAYYNVNGLKDEKTGKLIIDEKLLPEDEEEIIDINKFINEVNIGEEQFELNLVNNTINCNINKDKQYSKLDLNNEKIITLIEKALHNEKINNIEITFNNNTMWLNKEDSKEKITKKLLELLKISLKLNITENHENTDYYTKIKEELLNKTLDDLLTTKLKIKINKEDTAKFAENQDGNYSIIFNGTLFLNKWIEEKQNSLQNLFTISFEKDNENIKNINAKVIDRSKKLTETSEEDRTEFIATIMELLNSKKVSTININYKSQEEAEEKILQLDKNDIEGQVIIKIQNWIDEIKQELFGRENLSDVILGDFDTKELDIHIATQDNIKLEDGEKERDYKLKFSANPITITFDWNYKESEEDTTNKKEILKIEHAGLISEEKIPKYTVAEENGKIKETDIRETKNNKEKYKFLGWKKATKGAQDKENEESEHFDFKKEIIHINTTLQADWIKIDDIDNKIMGIIDEYNQSNNESANKIFHLGYNFNESKIEKLRVDILEKDKSLNDIKNTGLMVSLEKFLKEQNISKIIIGTDNNDNLYTLDSVNVENISTDKIKEKIIEILNKLINGIENAKQVENNNIKLETLIGKTLKISINQSNEDEEFAKEYKIIFEEVLNKDNIISDVLKEFKEGTEDSVYKYDYTNSEGETNGKINIEVMHSGNKLSTQSGTNIIAILKKLLEDEKIKDVSLIYGEKQVKSIKEMIQNISNTSEIKKAIEDFFKEKWNEICSCNNKCCLDGVCTWDKATNNCLIEASRKLTLQVELSEAYEFDKEDTKKTDYDINFDRSTVKLTLNFNNSEEILKTKANNLEEIEDNHKKTINVPEGKPLVESELKQYLPIYEEHLFKEWCKDLSLSEKYQFTDENKVTGDFELYANWYNVVNTKKDIKEKITEKMSASSDNSSTIDNVLREEITEGGEGEQVTIKIENEEESLDKIYNTALAQVIKDELSIEGVDKIEVKLNDSDSPVVFSGLDTSQNSEKKTELTEKLKSTNKLNDVIGKNLTIDIYLNKEKAVSEEYAEQVQNIGRYKRNVESEEYEIITYKLSFIGIFTKAKLQEFSKKILKDTVDLQAKILITVREDGGYDAKVPAKFANQYAFQVAAGCGGKSALMNFFKNEYMSKLEFSNDAGSMATLTKEESKTESDMQNALLGVPAMLGGGLFSKMSEFNNTHLNIKIILENNWKFESDDMSTFKMYFKVEGVS